MIAVISDVHGNLPALEAVLAEIDAAGVQRIWCLGDTTGYGPFVNETLALVSARCEIVLAGNHDLAVRGDLPPAQFGGTAGTGVEYAKRVLDETSRAVLSRLAPQKLLDGVELYHASARDPVWEYVREPLSATHHLKTQRQPLSFVGHSHMQVVFQLGPEDQHAVGGHVPADTVVSLDGAAKRVINPGSVGQPRDRDPRAAWALLEGDRVTLRRVEYDIARMQQAVAAAGLPGEVGERLLLGW